MNIEELVRANIGIVVHEANRYVRLGLSREDLVAEGYVGLVEAARRFDAGRGNRFVTYAVWWIRRFILKSLGEQSTLVKVPYLHKKRLREIREIERLLEKQLARRPGRDEIESRLSAEVSEVDLMFSRGLRELRLEDPVRADGDQRIVDLLATRDDGAERRLLRLEVDALLEDALCRLTDQQREVLFARYGLNGKPAETLRQVGTRLKLSGERVRQIERQAKQRLRGILTPRLIRAGGQVPSAHRSRRRLTAPSPSSAA